MTIEKKQLYGLSTSSVSILAYYLMNSTSGKMCYTKQNRNPKRDNTNVT